MASLLWPAVVMAQEVEAEPEAFRTVVRPLPAVGGWDPPQGEIDRSQMEDAGVDLGEVLDAQPGLRVQRLGGLGAFATVSIRGSSADQVRVYLDGIPLQSADGAPVDLSTLPLGPMASVALYRGGAPVLFGGSAVGGALALRTRRLARPHLEVEGGGGAFGTRFGRLFLGHGDQTWGVGASVDYLATDADFTYPTDGGTAWEPADDGVLTRQNAASEHLSALAKAWWAPAPGVRLTALNLFSLADRGLPGVGLFQTASSHLRQLRDLAGIRLEVGTRSDPSVQLTVMPWASWSRVELQDPAGEIGLGADDTVHTALASGLQGAVRVPVSFGPGSAYGLTPLLAVAWRWERFTPEDGVVTRASSTRHLLSAAAAVEAGLGPMATSVRGSARLEFEQAALVADGTPSLDAAPTVQEDLGASWRVEISQRSLPDTVITASVSRSLRFPSLYERFGDTGWVLGNPDLRPEEGLTLDGGIVYDASWLTAGDAWSFEVRGFGSWMEDLIQYAQNAQGVSRPDNVSSAQLAGVEIGTWGDVLQHLRFRGSLTWLSALDTSETLARSGKRLPFRPEWQAFARLEGYDRPLGWVHAWGARVELEVMAGDVLDHANLVRPPARVLLGLGAWIALAQDQVRLDLNVRNVTSSQVQDRAGFPLPGVTAMASLRWTPALEELGEEGP